MTIRPKFVAPILLSCFATLAGCSGATQAGPVVRNQPQPNPTAGTPSGPIEGGTTPTAPAPTANYSGTFAVVTPLDLTQKGVLPGVLGPMLGALSELHDHPGKAILDIIAAANIPTVSDAVKGLPGFIYDLLSGALDTLIQKELYANVPIADQITSIISGITSLSNTVDLHASLTVKAPGSNGSVEVDAQVTDVSFKLLDKTQLISFDAGEKAAATATLTGTLTPHANAPIADADLTMSGGKMTLPFGELLLQAAGPLLFAQFGGATNLHDALENLVPCQAAAADISSQLDGFLSETLVDQICTTAVGIIADEVTSLIDGVQLSNVGLNDGTATLLDVSKDKPQPDNQSDTLELGQWNISFDVAGSTVTVPSTFSGERVP
jgi:hypothetical protein